MEQIISSIPIDGVDQLLYIDPSVSILSSVISFLVSLAVYLITAGALYTIAQRRELDKPWLAWVPVGQLCMLGTISDHYQLTARYTTTNNRKTLLWLQIVMLVLLSLALLLSVDAMIQAQRMDNTAPDYINTWEHLMMDLKGVVVVALLLFVTAVLTLGAEYVALYDVYRSCDPDSSVVYLVLSIFLSITMPIFLLIVCDKDAGMPKQMITRPLPQKAWKSARRRREFYARVIKLSSQANYSDESSDESEED
jgi:hypothetical protein